MKPYSGYTKVEEIEPGHWYASLETHRGAWGDGDTPEEAIEQLVEAIKGWHEVGRKLNIDHSDCGCTYTPTHVLAEETP